jgi:penicillin-binding protein 1A
MKRQQNAAPATRQAPRRSRSWLRRLLLAAGLIAGLTLVGAVVGGFVLYQRLAADLPDVTVLEHYQPDLVTRVYDRHERLVAEFFVEKRLFVPLQRIPLHVRLATIAAEDSRFYSHSGIDALGMLRALWANLRSGEVKEGASTITQQVARSLFLTPERTLRRKLREIILAHRIEQHYGKDRILELYLNQIFYGHNAYGIEAAAQLYFGKSAQDLSLAEGAVLAGLPPAPNVYSPLNHPELSKRRRAHVLRRMVAEGYLSSAEAERVARLPLVADPSHRPLQAPTASYFTEYVRQYLEATYGADALYRSGLTVHTTLDLRLQQAAEHALRHGLLAIDKRIRHGAYTGPLRHVELGQDTTANATLIDTALASSKADTTIRAGALLPAVVLNVRNSEILVALTHARGRIPPAGWAWVQTASGVEGRNPSPAQFLRRGDVILTRVTQVDPNGQVHRLALEQEPLVQGALLAMEAGSGHILAMVGGYDFASSKFNRAVQAQRQPGSAFKPIVYATALAKGLTPDSRVDDSPMVLTLPNGKQWRPTNYDHTFLGPVSLRTALALSRNVATVRLLRRLGRHKVCAYAKRLGIRSRLQCYPSLALGASSVTLNELTAVYSVFANGGLYVEPTFVTKIVDRDGRVLAAARPAQHRVMSQTEAATLTSMLESVVQEGTGRRVQALGRPVAGKTGTTNDFRDAWFLGYTPGLIAGVWVGFDDHTSLGAGETGGRVASPIWLAFMQEALQDRPRMAFPLPSEEVMPSQNDEELRSQALASGQSPAAQTKLSSRQSGEAHEAATSSRRLSGRERRRPQRSPRPAPTPPAWQHSDAWRDNFDVGGSM